MRLNFKKISAISASVLLTGMTMGVAAAANYPNPFVVGGNADVAVVYGTGDGVSSLDVVQSGNIQSDLQSYMGSSSGGSVSVSTNGDVVALDTSSTRIWLNTSLNTAKSTLTKTDLPVVLEDSTFSGNVDAKLTSTIKVGAGTAVGSATASNDGKVVFLKQPKSSDDPTIGISLGSSTDNSMLYNASVTMKATNFTNSDSEGETIHLFGKDFVVSTATDTTSLVLFSSAEEVTLTKTSGENPSATVNISGTDYTIELTNGDSSTAYLSVDGDAKSIAEGNSKKVGGIEIAVKSVTSSDVAGITATLLVGSEKITFTSGSTVTMGSEDDPVDGTTAYIVGGTTACTELAVAVGKPDSSHDALLAGETFVDPVFGSFKIDFAGLSSPLDDTNRKEISISNSGDTAMTLAMTDSDGNAGTIEFAYNGTYATAYAHNPVRKPANWRLADDSNYSIFVHEGANVTEDDYLMLGNEDYGHLLQVTAIYNYTGTDYTKDYVKLQDVFSGETYTSTMTSECTTGPCGTIAIDGKSYNVQFKDTGDSGSATFKYPTSDSANGNTWVFYPTMDTESGARVSLYEPLNIPLNGVNGTTGKASTTIRLPDGDGYTDVVFTYVGGAAAVGNWSITVGGTSVGNVATKDAVKTNTTGATIGELNYNITSSGTVNRTMLYLNNPEATTTALEEPSVVIFEPKDTHNEYHAVVVNLETAMAGTSDAGVGVDDVLFTQQGDEYHGSATLSSDSDIAKDIDWFGTLVTTDSSDSDQKTVTVSLPLSQVYAQIYVGEEDSTVSASSTSTSATALGEVLVKDSEVSSVSSKNLIVVGGSCINSAAATLVGGAYCGAAFTDATGVGSGQFLIKGYDGGFTSGKIALLVAGYEVADTVNAAKYLTTQTVDTSKEYKGTTSTSAELVTETA